MGQRELAELLLRKAAQDEAAMEYLLPHADLDDELIGFHAQQLANLDLAAQGEAPFRIEPLR